MKLPSTGLCLLVLAFLAAPAESATRTVRSRRDSGSGSLRQTLARARAGDTIVLRTNGTIELESELVFDKNVTLRGLPAGRNAISGAGSTRILRVSEGVTATLEGLTLANGTVEEMGEGAGGAINNGGTLTVRNCTLIGNMSDYIGGAIWNGGTLVLDRSWVFNSYAYEFAGGIYNTGTLQVSRSTISANVCPTVAGAILNEGEVTIDGSTFSENDGDTAGAILSYGYAVVTNSTFAHNYAGSDEGAIHNRGDMVIRNSTVSLNRSEDVGGITNSGQLSLIDSTVTGNYSTSGVGGILNYGVLRMGNTIVAGNHAGSVERPGPDLQGVITSLGHNLIGASTDASGFVESDLLDVDPRLGPLQDNGGYTPTHALLPGSPALDAGDNALVDPADITDQRGGDFLRFVDGDGNGTAVVDIGAFEHQGADIQLNKQATGRAVFGTRVTYTLTVRNLGAEVSEGVTVTDALPAGAAFLSASSTQGTLTTPPPGTGGTVTVSLGDLSPGATARIRITVRVSTRPPLANTATVTAASFDPDLTNNQDTVVLRR